MVLKEKGTEAGHLADGGRQKHFREQFFPFRATQLGAQSTLHLTFIYALFYPMTYVFDGTPSVSAAFLLTGPTLECVKQL